MIRYDISRSQWPCGLRRWSAVRNPPVAWMTVCCERCVLSGRGLYDKLITRTEESYRLWCVVVCYLETSRMRRPWPTGGCCVKKNMTFTHSFIHSAVCLTTGLKPLPKRALHIVRYRAASFK